MGGFTRPRFRGLLGSVNPTNPAPLTNPSVLQALQQQMETLNANFAAATPNENYADAFFAYPVSFGSGLAPATSVQANITIQSDSDFEWLKSTYYANKHGATTPISADVDIPLTIQITDTGSGAQIFNIATPFQTVAGRQGLPFVNPVSRLFTKNSTINFSVANIDAADTYDNIFFVLLGRKIWNYQNA